MHQEFKDCDTSQILVVEDNIYSACALTSIFDQY